MSSMCLDQICQKYYNRILNYCLGKTHGNIGQAEDITNDVFYLLVKKWDLYTTHQESAIATWLYKTANNRLKESLHHAALTILTDEISPIEPSALDVPDYEEELLRYEQYLIDIQNTLRPEEAELFRMRVIEKKSYNDIANAFGISVRALRLRWYRLQQKLLIYLRDKGYIDSIPSLDGLI